MKWNVQQMGERIKQYVREHSWFLVLVTILLVAIVGPLILDRLNHFREWWGFSEYPNERKTTQFKPGGEIDSRTVIQEPRRAKTYWDWLQLLGVPAAVAITGFWFNKRQNERQQIDEDHRAQDAALQENLNKMSELLIDKEPARRSPPARRYARNGASPHTNGVEST